MPAAIGKNGTCAREDTKVGSPCPRVLLSCADWLALLRVHANRAQVQFSHGKSIVVLPHEQPAGICHAKQAGEVPE